jgi:hypothetical protein
MNPPFSTNVERTGLLAHVEEHVVAVVQAVQIRAEVRWDHAGHAGSLGCAQEVGLTVDDDVGAALHGGHHDVDTVQVTGKGGDVVVQVADDEGDGVGLDERTQCVSTIRVAFANESSDRCAALDEFGDDLASEVSGGACHQHCRGHGSP